ncbi:hypothetical protein R3W88_001379 [Solanum pinnatisectum]|uniref:Retrotransposon gag domain-containing protein n=1 Tax=Solanum pinnatisectum TaxID=50273 RepID=A0AAV9MLV3_9SOLN|nr:hypothetical protein R3W88_001379 [Solanum pinnatisectum]
MDFTINTVASSEIIPTSSIAAYPSSSVATKSPMEVIVRLEQQIGELNLLVAQYQAASHNLPPDVRQKGPMPPLFPTLNVNHYVEIENDAKSIDVETINRKMKSLEDVMRGFRGFDSSQSVRYEKLCTFLEVELLPGYKIPKFEKFSGSGNSFFHLKISCEKLISVGNNKEIRIKLFNQSLTGKAFEWYSKQDVTKWSTWDDLANTFVDHYKFHVEIALNRISITKIKSKSTE